MISIETAPSELRSEHLKENLTFLDRQRLIQPSVNSQVHFDFQGLRQSYKDDPKHPESQFISRFGRVWIYDMALSIFVDLKVNRFRQAGYQVGRVMQLALQEKERGYDGLWHFSYNTQGDCFVDPRGPTGANSWCLKAIYAYVLATGELSALAWANRVVQSYLFGRQVMDPLDARYGLIRAGFHNPDDIDRIDGMGYHVYEGERNRPYEFCVLEHNANVVGTYRLAFRATQKYAPSQTAFLRELIHRHEILMRGMRRLFWQGDHFVSAVDGKGHFFLGTDGQPSIAVDNNTWAPHVFVPYDPDFALTSLRYCLNRFLIQTPSALVEGFDPSEEFPSVPPRLEGAYFFTASFSDPFVDVPSKHRPTMEKLIQLEATYGLICFIWDLLPYLSDSPDRLPLQRRVQDLYQSMIHLQRLYGSCAAPYASANVPGVFTTLNSVTTAATAATTAALLLDISDSDWIGVSPPAEFVVDGRAPLKSC